jgi:two-component system, OmpR family, KDP operon response regulator KdpE
MTMRARVLAVDDEPAIRAVLEAGLKARGLVVETVGTGKEALEAIQYRHPDVVLLDLLLPDLRGSAVIERVRAWSNVPIIMLSVEGSEAEKVRALDLGADDYVTKPFGLDELVSRIRVTFRRLARTDPVSSVFQVGDLAIDFQLRRVTIRGRTAALSPTEYSILKSLAQNAGRIMSHRALLREVWGPAYGTEGHYLHVFIGRLRRKLEDDPGRPRYLVTEPGVGYRLNLDQSDGACEVAEPQGTDLSG